MEELVQVKHRLGEGAVQRDKIKAVVNQLLVKEAKTPNNNITVSTVDSVEQRQN